MTEECLTGSIKSQEELKGACQWGNQEDLPLSLNDKLWRDFSVEPQDPLSYVEGTISHEALYITGKSDMQREN